MRRREKRAGSTKRMGPIKRVVAHHNDAATFEALSAPRDDWMVRERPAEGADGHFDLEDGPFRVWQRSIEPADDGGLTETTEFRLATPLLATPFGWLFGWAIRNRRLQVEAPFWAPPERFDAQAAHAFTLLIAATMAAAYLGTLLSQTISFVADDLAPGTGDADNRGTQGLVTGMTRIGALLSLLIVYLADRHGRRRMLVTAGLTAATFAVLAAASTNIWFFGSAELVSRGATTGLGLLIGIFAAEEAPAGSRAWTASILALFAGLGSGMVLWLIPLADTSTGGWRILFLVAVLAIPVILALGRRLPESRRFTTMTERKAEPAPITPVMRRRFTMLAMVGFATSLFAAPSSNFQNEYLRDERGFSGTQISLFSTITSTPIGIGVAIFGPMADRRGRRIIGAIGILAGVGFNVVRYGFGGPLMWIAGTLSTVIGAAAIPALGVYGPEMFPTSRRGLANGMLTLVAVVGSVIGLAFVGEMSERWSFGATFAVLAIVPILATAILRWYPETAQKALEELNPQDG